MTVKISLIFVVGFLFWLIETACFGWNNYPVTNAEKMCDQIVVWLVFLGIWRSGYLTGKESEAK